MSRNMFSAMVAGQLMALAEDHAGGELALMAQEIEAARSGDGVQSAAVERYSVTGGVAVVPVNGLLTPNMFVLEKYFGWTTYVGLTETMEALAANDDVRAVVMQVNSPGGMVLGCEDAAKAVAACANVKPVHAFADPMAASAAYWLASQATEISMTQGAVVGSIGVAVSSSAPVAPNGAGDQWFDFTSTHAAAKIPDPSGEAGRAEIQRRLDETEARFHHAVETGRGMAAGELVGRMSTTGDPHDGGASFHGTDAVARGLADRVETRTEFMARISATYQARPRKSTRGYSAQAQVAQAKAAI